MIGSERWTVAAAAVAGLAIWQLIVSHPVLGRAAGENARRRWTRIQVILGSVGWLISTVVVVLAMTGRIDMSFRSTTNPNIGVLILEAVLSMSAGILVFLALMTMLGVRRDSSLSSRKRIPFVLVQFAFGLVIVFTNTAGIARQSANVVGFSILGAAFVGAALVIMKLCAYLRRQGAAEGRS